LRPEQSPPPRPAEPARDPAGYLVRYAAVIVKNIVGWALMLAALGLGSFFPIPIGTPLFLIGFAMITLPGKRKLTSGALRGIPIKLHTRTAFWWRLAASLLLPPAVLWFLEFQRWPVLHPSQMPLGRLCLVYSLAILSAWALTWLFLHAVNAVVRILPKVRRRVRPWMRDHGINLLPPRRKRRFPLSSQSQASSQSGEDERILSINAGHARHRDRETKP
jgi:hypothetical protein